MTTLAQPPNPKAGPLHNNRPLPTGSDSLGSTLPGGTLPGGAFPGSNFPGQGLAARTLAQLRQPVVFDFAFRVCCAVLLWLAFFLVTLWWNLDGGASTFGASTLTSWPDALIGVGQLSGLYSSLLILAQVFLMAGIPIIENAFGRRRLVTLHRFAGLGSVTFLLLHLTTITWGYAGSLMSIPGTFANFVSDYPGLVLAIAGTGFALAISSTSLRSVRARLPEEGWLQLYGYLGVALALPHQLWTGELFLRRPLVSAAWWVVWALAFGALLIWRVALPAWRTWRHRLRVAAVVREDADTVSIHLTGRQLDRLKPNSGQFFVWRFLGGRGLLKATPYALAASPVADRLRISVKNNAANSAALASIKPKSFTIIQGPYGRLSERSRSRRKVALIGAGVGITPMRALAEDLEYAPGEACVLYRYSARALFEAEFAHLSRSRGLELFFVPGHRRSGKSWLSDHVGEVSDEAALAFWIPDLSERDVFVCGPELFVAQVRATALRLGLSTENFHVESFGW